MKKRVLCSWMMLCLLLGNLLSSCAPVQKTKYDTHTFDYFDTVSTITGYESSQEEFDAVVHEILAQLKEYHQLYSIYHRFDGLENLCTINELVDGAHRTVKVDRKIIDLLLYAKEMYQKTGGVLNVAMGSVLAIWHDYRTVGMDDPSSATLPPMDRLQEAAKHTDISKLIINEEQSTVTLADPLMKLDVGAIAKGYAVEQIAKSMEAKGISGYMLNIGGNVRAVGEKPDGQGWVVGIENPDGEDFLATLQVRNESVVTSGSYQRYYVVDGKNYHHIIHPDTLMPAETFVAVSVVCKDSGLADALSTALFCLPQEKGEALIQSFQGVEAHWLKKDGTKISSKGWNNFLSN